MLPAIVERAGATDIAPAFALFLSNSNSVTRPEIAVFNTVAALASL